MAQAPLSLRERLDAALAVIRERDGYQKATCAAMIFSLDLAKQVTPARGPAGPSSTRAADLAVQAAWCCVESGFARTALAEAEIVAAAILKGPRRQAWLYPLVNVNDPLGAARAALALAEDVGLDGLALSGICAIEAR